MKAKKVGIIGKKLGMTQLYDDGRMTGVTVVDFSDMKAIGYRTPERDGYTAVILGYDFRESLKGGKKVETPRYVREIRLEDTSLYEDENKVLDALSGTSKVDVSGVMKGRGFAGAMKRWHFGGGPATHGSKTHRRVGSIGQCTFPAKVFKGKKMPGHMGNVKKTILSQKLVRVDLERKLLFIRGSVPGARNRYVMVRDAIKG